MRHGDKFTSYVPAKTERDYADERITGLREQHIVPYGNPVIRYSA